MMVHVMVAAKHDASAYFLFISAVNDRTASDPDAATTLDHWGV